jgi:hypothetical protein
MAKTIVCCDDQPHAERMRQALVNLIPEAAANRRYVVRITDDDKERTHNRGQCGLATPRDLAGANPAWVIASHEASIEPCGAPGNRGIDA